MADAYSALQKSMWGPLQDIARIPIAKGKTIEERLSLIEEEAAVRDLLNRYTYFYDGGDLEGVMTVFADECTLVNPRGTYIGAAAIKRNYAYLIGGRKLSFHYATNVMVRILDGGKEAAMGAFYNSILAYPSRTLAQVGGTYADRLKKIGGEWKIIERRITYNHRSRLAADSPYDAAKPIPEPSRAETSRDWIEKDTMM